jgi:Na+/proline symporter
MGRSAPLSPIDVAVVAAYLAGMVAIGAATVRRASRSVDSYFLAANRLPWYVLGTSNAAAMWDVTGTMWLVYNVFAYGMKGIWLAWIWPTFNQVFLMVYLSSWIRRSNALTGGEWITSRFGSGRGGELARSIVVAFALITTVGFIAYDFQGMGKFMASFLPWDLSPNTCGVLVMTMTLVYVLLGGMISVVLTDVVQYAIMTLCSLLIALMAMRLVSRERLASAVPTGWDSLRFGWTLDLDWRGLIPSLQQNLAGDGYSLFGLFFTAMLLKGVLVSIAGPAPSYDMQRILAARSPREASLMSGFVSVVLLPRWWMVGGITVLALGFVGPRFGTASVADFEMVLPWVMTDVMPAGLRGLLLAGLLAASMSTFSATVNAGAAYLVNDLYKRHVAPWASARHTVAAGWVAQIAILALGALFGSQAASINHVTQWIVNGLWGGYTAPNLLKWHWWRLNGYGYFWGMLAGVASALALPKLSPGLHPIEGFPFILVASLAACVAGSLLTAPDPDGVLEPFYRQVRPWGLWGPVRRKVLARDPSFRVNRNMRRDVANVAVGIVWQVPLVTIPLYMVLRDVTGLTVSATVLLAASWVLKKSWLERIEDA